jgi:hypothetical protein
MILEQYAGLYDRAAHTVAKVVDRWGSSHEVPKLGVFGTSVMGTSGCTIRR